MLVRPKQSQGRFSTRVRLGKEELSFAEEFRYLGHVMTANCRDDMDIKKTILEAKCSWQYAGQEILNFHLLKKKLNSSNHIITTFMDELFGVIHTRTPL